MTSSTAELSEVPPPNTLMIFPCLFETNVIGYPHLDWKESLYIDFPLYINLKSNGFDSMYFKISSLESFPMATNFTPYRAKLSLNLIQTRNLCYTR